MAEKLVCYLIDDDEDDQEIFTIALKDVSTKIQVEFAANGIIALNKLRTTPDFIPDLIFLDLNMPRLNGKQCLIEIKKITRLNHIPIIIYSTASDHGTIKEIMELGASSYLIKPASVRELTGALNSLLKKFTKQFSI